ncbi:hypothetical protein HZS_6775 [Henneguya salminicola]|nr:hypothetical protein HZS_6775 [Henneguya salminicola]
MFKMDASIPTDLFSNYNRVAVKLPKCIPVFGSLLDVYKIDGLEYFQLSDVVSVLNNIFLINSETLSPLRCKYHSDYKCNCTLRYSGNISYVEKYDLVRFLNKYCALMTKKTLSGNSYQTQPCNRQLFKVFHTSFGGADGMFDMNLYSYPDAKCISCLECNAAFCFKSFVRHTHNSQNYLNTVEWGFDERNWRNLIHVYERLPEWVECDTWNDVLTKFYNQEEIVESLQTASPITTEHEALTRLDGVICIKYIYHA